jgi:uncharacterized protein (TIGR02466 family)
MAFEHEVINLFPLPIYKAKLGIDFNDKQTAHIMKNVERKNLLPRNQGGNAVTVNDRILEHSSMKSIRAQIQKHIDYWFDLTMKPSDKIKLEITQSWLSLTLQGESHHRHNHANSILSGVLYYSVAEHDAINFIRPGGMQANMFSEEGRWHIPSRERTYFNSPEITLPVENGDIILFPSQLHHEVHRVKENTRRISLPFNTFFTGNLGSKDSYTYIRVKANP